MPRNTCVHCSNPAIREVTWRDGSKEQLCHEHFEAAETIATHEKMPYALPSTVIEDAANDEGDDA